METIYKYLDNIGHNFEIYLIESYASEVIIAITFWTLIVPIAFYGVLWIANKTLDHLIKFHL